MAPLTRALLLVALAGAPPLPPPPAAVAQSSQGPWQPMTVPLFGATYSPDIGLLVGVGVIHTRYGFHALPPSMRLLAEAEYATAARSYRARVAAEFRRPDGTTFQIGLRASGLEQIRFYGIGNETVSSQVDSVNRVRQKQFTLSSAVTVPLAPRLRLSVGPVLQYTRTQTDPGTLLTTTGPYYGAGDFGEVGARALLELDTRDSPTAPARGARVNIGATWHPALWHVASPFGTLSAEGSTYVSPGDARDLTLALRAGGSVVTGTVPFQELVYVGGATTVRGYAEQRFAGRRGAYFNAEVRVLAGRFAFGDIGIFGLGDAGRVWTDGEASDRRHAAAGGGVWVAWQHRRADIVSIAAVRSPERTGIYLRAGLMF